MQHISRTDLGEGRYAYTLACKTCPSTFTFESSGKKLPSYCPACLKARTQALNRERVARHKAALREAAHFKTLNDGENSYEQVSQLMTLDPKAIHLWRKKNFAKGGQESDDYFDFIRANSFAVHFTAEDIASAQNRWGAYAEGGQPEEVNESNRILIDMMSKALARAGINAPPPPREQGLIEGDYVSRALTRALGCEVLAGSFDFWSAQLNPCYTYEIPDDMRQYIRMVDAGLIDEPRSFCLRLREATQVSEWFTNPDPTLPKTIRMTCIQAVERLKKAAAKQQLDPTEFEDDETGVAIPRETHWAEDKGEWVGGYGSGITPFRSHGTQPSVGGIY